MGKIVDIFRLLRGLSTEEDELLSKYKNISKEDFNSIRKLMKLRHIRIKMKTYGPSGSGVIYPYILLENKENEEVASFTEGINESVESEAKAAAFRNLSSGAFAFISGSIAPNIVGLEQAKHAAALLLFSEEPVHILLLGDPGTGKTDILRSACDFAPISSFGLGSGTSGTGLAVTISGENVLKGLLPLADKGVCCIDELNLMKKDDRAALYSAMEKGFITYDKGGKHNRFDANVKIIATANPIGDRFTGMDVSELKKQLPFDSALLSRFHLVFVIRKPGLDEFKTITTKILLNERKSVSQETISFIRDYLVECSRLSPRLPKGMESQITEFATALKEKETDYIVEISPRTVIGIMRLIKASARIEMRDTANDSDFARVKEMITASLDISPAKPSALAGKDKDK